MSSTLKEKGNLIISGSGSATGGEYDQVKISGSGRISGDIECEKFLCNGSSKVEGDIEGVQITINGSTKVGGDVRSKETLKVNGSTVIEGSVLYKEFKISGSSRILGDTSGEHLILRGSVKIEGDCEAEYAEFNGSFKIEGLLNADKVEIELNGRSYVKEIGGEIISVTRTKSNLLDRLFKPLAKELTAEVIEGDKVEIEYTQADVVRGNHIKIGPGCKVDLVEYKGELDIHDNASVKEIKKV
ncbi:polymer-forming cytoskeletal protein [Alkalihalobacillus pseudalcaliphilus]|uniref:polymer-forming cytoskeletal protein n=1 Tax=Alkalihalobacillus pseudalcaliphilus TaxID=79884 RepID=UPI00064D861A|nr:polymer-forming cytoskeletal protein [Alkalihalobacillus pseudalcaliphilus]KMK75606.1 hypothetical protein AB990_09980 [Alkalihalobacillus pseudalcaliphilus]